MVDRIEIKFYTAHSLGWNRGKRGRLKKPRMLGDSDVSLGCCLEHRIKKPKKTKQGIVWKVYRETLNSEAICYSSIY